MAKKTLAAKIASYLELKAQEDALKKSIKEVEDALKAELANQNKTDLQAGKYGVRIVEGNQRRFDTKAFQQEHPDVYESYRHNVPTKSFQAYVIEG